MTCDATRKRLLKNSAGPKGSSDRTATAHLERCDDCRAFADRLDAARGALRDHHSRAQPDAAFSGRVLERIRAENAAGPFDALGWAALRVLPAALLLTALATWTAMQPHHGFAGLLLPGAGDDVVAAFIVSGLEETVPDETGKVLP